ncbi:MAG: type II toxin-antitoxin system RelE/ParE family toxin [Spirochaetia bacterium]|nr:type II toxin-antitoxin system RelE/ParE family toxin [Spirochaetia bacterium]
MAEIEIFWSTEALSDLDEIITYISRDSPSNARNFALKILESIETIRTFPRIGRIVPEYHDPQLREILFRNYRIVYKYSENRAEIVTIFQGSKLL